jgi:tyrosine-protein phosphatase YwqE
MRIFSKSRIIDQDFSAIGTDLHCHVLPGMDDGSASLDESLRMIRGMAEAGFRRIIATPHVNSALYPNTREQILGQVAHLQEVVDQENIPVTLEGSGEYHLDFDFLRKLETGEVIPFGKEKYLLVELPFMKPGFAYADILSGIHSHGYKPVLAHPERYGWLMGNMRLYRELKEREILFQINLNSISGLYGFPAKIAARQLIDAGMIDFAGSDAHHEGHVLALSNVLKQRYFVKLLESNNLLNPGLL